MKRHNAAWVLVTLLVGCSGNAGNSDGGSGGGTVATGGGSSSPSTGGGGGSSATGGGGGGSTGGGTASSDGGMPGLFHHPHAWNTDVSAAAVSSRSQAILGALTALGGWGNGNTVQVDFSFAVLHADGTTPRRTVTSIPGRYCYGGPDCEPVPMQMPLPADGNAEGSADYACNYAGEDCHVLVVEHDEQKLYELYNTSSSGAGLVARGAFVWDLTKQYPAELRGEQCTSADAAGLPIAALLPTVEEVAAGAVPHALRFILPNDRMKVGVYVRPATHAGGPEATNPDAPPYGVRLRLKPGFDVSGYSAGAKVILTALQRYGMILSDGGNIALTFADDRRSATTWEAQGIDSHTFGALRVSDFEVVELGAEIPVTNDCVRTP